MKRVATFFLRFYKGDHFSFSAGRVPLCSQLL